MNSKLKLSLLACALAAASIAAAQTSDQTNIPPPNDIIRLPRSVTTPDMPIIVEAPRDDIGHRALAAPGDSGAGVSPAQSIVRSLGSGSEAVGNDSDLGTGSALRPGSAMGAGSTLGAGSMFSGAATAGVTAQPIGRVNEATSSAGSDVPTDIGGVDGAESSAGLNGGIAPSSGGAGGIFGSSGTAWDNAAAGSAAAPNATDSNGNAGSAGAANAPSGSITIPSSASGAARSTGAARSGGAASGGK